MEKRLKDYLKKMEGFHNGQQTERELEKLLRDLLLQIRFFQHERLIHLIVTITFAILTILVFLVNLFLMELSLYLMALLLLVLLVPYIRHYYILENGVQRLYRYHDEFQERYESIKEGKQPEPEEK